MGINLYFAGSRRFDWRFGGIIIVFLLLQEFFWCFLVVVIFVLAFDSWIFFLFYNFGNVQKGCRWKIFIFGLFYTFWGLFCVEFVSELDLRPFKSLEFSKLYQENSQKSPTTIFFEFKIFSENPRSLSQKTLQYLSHYERSSPCCTTFTNFWNFI